MLLEFTVGNYKSFKTPVTFSMLASSLKEHQESNLFDVQKYNLLKSAVIVGANASGKSNLFKALSFMKHFVFSSAKDMQATERINVEPFRLSTETENEPSHFEVIFLLDTIRYRYGFRVTNERVESEWLFYVPRTKEARLFTREKNDIALGKDFVEGRGIQNKTRNNALFLSVVAQFNGKISSKVLQWFKQLNVISGFDDRGYVGVTISKLVEFDLQFKQWLLNYLKIADIDILDIHVDLNKIDMDKLPATISEKILSNESLPKGKLKAIHEYSIETSHKKYMNKDKQEMFEIFDIDENESQGTKKILALAGPIWDTLKNGKILFIDEFEARLHQKLTRSLVKLFHSPKSNSLKAQFVLATHDANLLDRELFRRDQIWFIQKDRYGVSDLYSLADYKESNKITRKDASYCKNYMIGRYGGVPVINDFDDLFEDIDGQR